MHNNYGIKLLLKTTNYLHFKRKTQILIRFAMFSPLFGSFKILFHHNQFPCNLSISCNFFGVTNTEKITGRTQMGKHQTRQTKKNKKQELIFRNHILNIIHKDYWNNNSQKPTKTIFTKITFTTVINLLNKISTYCFVNS